MRSFKHAIALVAAASLLVGAAGTPARAVDDATTTIKMSDGVELAAEVLLPEEGKKFPVLVNMTPYGPATYFSTYLGNGYAHVNVVAPVGPAARSACSAIASNRTSTKSSSGRRASRGATARSACTAGRTRASRL